MKPNRARALKLLAAYLLTSAFMAATWQFMEIGVLPLILLAGPASCAYVAIGCVWTIWNGFGSDYFGLFALNALVWLLGAGLIAFCGLKRQWAPGGKFLYFYWLASFWIVSSFFSAFMFMLSFARA